MAIEVEMLATAIEEFADASKIALLKIYIGSVLVVRPGYPILHYPVAVKAFGPSLAFIQIKKTAQERWEPLRGPTHVEILHVELKEALGEDTVTRHCIDLQ